MSTFHTSSQNRSPVPHGRVEKRGRNQLSPSLRRAHSVTILVDSKGVIIVKYSRYQDKDFPYLVDSEYSPRYSACICNRQRYDLAGLIIASATRLINEI